MHSRLKSWSMIIVAVLVASMPLSIAAQQISCAMSHPASHETRLAEALPAGGHAHHLASVFDAAAPSEAETGVSTPPPHGHHAPAQDEAGGVGSSGCFAGSPCCGPALLSGSPRVEPLRAPHRAIFAVRFVSLPSAIPDRLDRPPKLLRI